MAIKFVYQLNDIDNLGNKGRFSEYIVENFEDIPTYDEFKK